LGPKKSYIEVVLKGLI